jgi:hypothetical protein
VDVVFTAMKVHKNDGRLQEKGSTALRLLGVTSENGEIMMTPKIRTENSGDKLSGYFNVKVEIDNNIKVVDESGAFKSGATLYSHVTLLELLGAIFEEFQDYITVKSGFY